MSPVLRPRPPRRTLQEQALPATRARGPHPIPVGLAEVVGRDGCVQASEPEPWLKPPGGGCALPS